MRSTNHRKYPTHSYRNDCNFDSFEDSSASVLLTSNAARFDGEFSAAGQIAPAKNILSDRAIAETGKSHMQAKTGLARDAFPVASGSDLAKESAFCYRTTLFDSVMDYLDRYDRMAAIERSRRNAERS